MAVMRMHHSDVLWEAGQIHYLAAMPCDPPTIVSLVSWPLSASGRPADAGPLPEGNTGSAAPHLATCSAQEAVMGGSPSQYLV